MERIGVFEAKSRLSELLARAENGEEMVITKHGRPIARIVPADPVDRERVREAVEALKQRRTRWKLGNLSWKKLRDEGRR
jgi:prevent-host-death family protein